MISLNTPLSLVLAVVAGYLLGSIPSGLLIGRWLRGIDIREFGSGRTGATNALRSLGARGFILTFLADAAKAMAAVVLARYIVGDNGDPTLAGAIGGLAAIIGHNWSVFIGFSGGRGVASSFGAMLVLFWPGALVGLIAAALLIATTKYVSLGSIVGTIVGLIATVIAIVVQPSGPGLLIFAVVTAVLVIARHRDNIARLRAGTERKIGQRANAAQQS